MYKYNICCHGCRVIGCEIHQIYGFCRADDWHIECPHKLIQLRSDIPKSKEELNQVAAGYLCPTCAAAQIEES